MKDIVIFKGYKHKGGVVHFRDITLDDLRAVFFPRSFYEKYEYLGSVPWKEDGAIFQAMEPLVIFMDHKAKPWWCPRWFLRFLNLFGRDNSIVRMRNVRMSHLLGKITKGYMIWDYKTKWTDYDLRISVSGTDQMQFLADAIESKFYEDGKRGDLANQIKEVDPETKYHKGYTVKMLNEELERLVGGRP